MSRKLFPNQSFGRAHIRGLAVYYKEVLMKGKLAVSLSFFDVLHSVQMIVALLIERAIVHALMFS